MNTPAEAEVWERLSLVRELADQAFSRAAGARLIPGNSVRLLKDAQENYQAWLQAIASAQRSIHFENYIIRDDSAGRMFAEALIAKAREGVRVRVIYDWMGNFGKTSRKFWTHLRDGGIEVRCYNPPRLDSPLGWLSRDHRKMVAIDAQLAFVTGLCVGQEWVGQPEKNREPWRDTGVEVRGPAVADIERAFAQLWAVTGEAIRETHLVNDALPAPAGDVALRVVAGVPNTAGMLRLDQLIAALARERLWLTDAYYAGTPSYVQALRAAAHDGVDVRFLVPGVTDIPLLRPLSRAGYRPLLEAGVRIFEWNGSMLHAKTGVADGRWARVGSTNLNLASWLGNCELDVVVEDEGFARQLEEMYLDDLANATEVVLDAKHRVRAPSVPQRARTLVSSGRGSAGRATAGALRIGNTVGAAMSDRRVLEPVETRIMTTAGVVLLGLAVLFALFPGVLAYPLIAITVWLAASLLYRGYKLYREKKRDRDKERSVPRPRQTISHQAEGFQKTGPHKD